MKEILKTIDKLNDSILDKNQEIKVIENPENAYYLRFGKADEREKDLYLAQKDLRDLFGKKTKLLDDLTNKITVKQCAITYTVRELNIKINLYNEKN